MDNLLGAEVTETRGQDERRGWQLSSGSVIKVAAVSVEVKRPLVYEKVKHSSIVVLGSDFVSVCFFIKCRLSSFSSTVHYFYLLCDGKKDIQPFVDVQGELTRDWEI